VLLSFPLSSFPSCSYTLLLDKARGEGCGRGGGGVQSACEPERRKKIQLKIPIEIAVSYF
jgi:hypothetical protein